MTGGQRVLCKPVFSCCVCDWQMMCFTEKKFNKVTFEAVCYRMIGIDIKNIYMKNSQGHQTMFHLRHQHVSQLHCLYVLVWTQHLSRPKIPVHLGRNCKRREAKSNQTFTEKQQQIHFLSQTNFIGLQWLWVNCEKTALCTVSKPKLVLPTVAE